MKHSLLALLASASVIALVLPAYAADPAPDAATTESADKPDADTSTEAPAEKAPEKAAEKPAEKAEAKPESKESKAEAKPKSGHDFTIIKLNGESIKDSEAEELWKGLFPGGAAPDFSTFDENIRQNVLRGMISERLLYQEASKEGFDKSEEVQKRLENLKKQLIIQTFIEHKAKKLVTDAQLRAVYAEKVSSLKHEEEVHARHILVASEDDAKAVEKELKKGTDFAALAKEKSIDKGSAEQGGDLGWFTKDKMVPEFAEAAFKLKKDEISDPVKTSFGWHIIQVEEKRPVKVPSFEDMRDDLQSEASNKAVQEYVESLLKKADITYYNPDSKSHEFSRNMQKK